MEKFMKLPKIIAAALITMGLSLSVMAQQPPAQGDQVDQLAQMVGLDEQQQKEIRGILEEMQGKVQELQMEARQLQQELRAEVKPGYDEGTIREQAKELGDVTGEISALSTLMQARIDDVFTEEQRETLNQRMEQMRQMQQQQQQRGMQ
jgi:hypothetical protein